MIKNKMFKWKIDQSNKNIKNHLATLFYKNIISAFTVNPCPIICSNFIIAIHSTLQYVRELEHFCYNLC